MRRIDIMLMTRCITAAAEMSVFLCMFVQSRHTDRLTEYRILLATAVLHMYVRFQATFVNL